jgi:hypothetical protein
VPGNRPCASRSGWPPAVAQNESRDTGGHDDPSPENRAGDGGDERGARLIGTLTLRGGAAIVRLHLSDDSVRTGAVRVTFVHGAGTALGAARHPSFRAGHPPCADRRVAGNQGQREHKRQQTLNEPHYTSRMLDGRQPVKRMVFKHPALTGRHILVLIQSAKSPILFRSEQPSQR